MRAVLLSYCLFLLVPAFAAAEADTLATLQRTRPLCFENGIHYLELGQNRRALDAWKEHRDILVSDRCFDASRAHQVIETIVNEGDSTMFALADSLYDHLWTYNAYKQYGATLETEVQRLIPLVSYDTQKKLKHQLKENDSTIIRTVKSWWNAHDPVLSTPENERRIEYFRRLSYSREHFMKNEESVYNTDDRGTIYIQYGEPSYIREGLLSADDTQIRSMLGDMSYFYGITNPRELFNLRNSIRQHYMPSRYEIWVYRNLNTSQSVIYIFGDPADGRSYGLRKSLEEFIPSDAYMGITTPFRFNGGARGYRAAWFIQLALYNELSTVDPYFGQQLYEYEQNWLDFMQGEMNSHAYQSMNSSTKAEMELENRRNKAPSNKSEVAERLGVIHQSIRQFTFLDSDNQPYRKAIIYTDADEDLLPNDQKIFFYKNPNYLITRSLYRVNNEYQKLEINTDTQQIDPNIILDKQPASVLTFSGDTTGRLIMSTELVRRSKAMTPNKEEKDIAASAVNPIPEHETTINTGSGISVSDLVFGYRGSTNHDNAQWPFVIPREAIQPYGSDLMVYFEVYHLQRGEMGIFPYTVEYKINRIHRGKPIPTDIRLQLQFKTDHSRDKQTLEIETTDLQPGTYRVQLTYSQDPQLNPENSVERSFSFQVQEPPEEGN